MASDLSLSRFCNKIATLKRNSATKQTQKKQHEYHEFTRNSMRENCKAGTQDQDPTQQMAFVQWAYFECGSKFFIWAFLSSTSPTYLWIRHTFWDLPCLHGFSAEISPQHLGQFFPSGFEGSETILSFRFRGCKILEKRFYLFEDGYTDLDICVYICIYIYVYVYIYICLHNII